MLALVLYALGVVLTYELLSDLYEPDRAALLAALAWPVGPFVRLYYHIASLCGK